MEIEQKPVQPRPNQTYINFYKFYYNRLGVEHPRWSTSQITTIIRLLWKKRKMGGAKGEKKIERLMSGRMKYRKAKLAEGFLEEDIKLNWKRLPH